MKTNPYQFLILAGNMGLHGWESVVADSQAWQISEWKEEEASLRCGSWMK